MFFIENLPAQHDLKEVVVYTKNKRGKYKKKCKCFYRKSRKYFHGFKWTGDCDDGYVNGKGKLKVYRVRRESEMAQPERWGDHLETYEGTYRNGYRYSDGIISGSSPNIEMEKRATLYGYFDDANGQVEGIVYDKEGQPCSSGFWKDGKIEEPEFQKKYKKERWMNCGVL